MENNICPKRLAFNNKIAPIITNPSRNLSLKQLRAHILKGNIYLKDGKHVWNEEFLNQIELLDKGGRND